MNRFCTTLLLGVTYSSLGIMVCVNCNSMVVIPIQLISILGKDNVILCASLYIPHTLMYTFAASLLESLLHVSLCIEMVHELSVPHCILPSSAVMLRPFLTVCPSSNVCLSTNTRVSYS